MITTQHHNTIVMKMTLPRSAAYQALLANRAYDIEFNGFLSNHAKHALIALEKLDAPMSRVEEYWNMYTTITPYNLKLHKVAEPWDKIPPITSDEWMSLRGKKEKWPNMCQFLDQELKEKYDNDVNRLVQSYAPDLLPGIAGALTHGIIHTGWAIDANSRWMTIEGLAYLNFSYLSVHPESFVSGAVNESSPAESLRRISEMFQTDRLSDTWIAKAKERYDENSGFHSELIPAGFQWEFSKVLSQQHEVMYGLPSWLDTMSVEQLVEHLHKTTVLLYLITLDDKDGHGNFLVLHTITSFWALEHVLNVVNDDGVSRNAIKCFYAAVVGLISTSGGGFPEPEAIDAAVAKYGGDDKIDLNAEELTANEWPKIVEKAIPETEEHNIKLVYVTRELWNRYNHWTGFREAAKVFTVTPNIGPSSGSFKA